jgi:ribonuclease P protein component
LNPGTSIKQSSDFRRIYARGKSAVSPCVVVYCRKNRLGVNRTGFTVSKKMGKAVVRNRVRRRLREIMRLNGARLEQGYDLILVARGRAIEAEYRRLEADVLSCCGRLHLMKKDVTS